MTRVRGLVEAPVRCVAIDEFLRSTSRIESKNGRVDSLILFINSRLTEQ